MKVHFYSGQFNPAIQNCKSMSHAATGIRSQIVEGVKEGTRLGDIVPLDNNKEFHFAFLNKSNEFKFLPASHRILKLGLDEELAVFEATNSNSMKPHEITIECDSFKQKIGLPENSTFGHLYIILESLNKFFNFERPVFEQLIMLSNKRTKDHVSLTTELSGSLSTPLFPFDSYDDVVRMIDCGIPIHKFNSFGQLFCVSNFLSPPNPRNHVHVSFLHMFRFNLSEVNVEENLFWSTFVDLETETVDQLLKKMERMLALQTHSLRNFVSALLHSGGITLLYSETVDSETKNLKKFIPIQFPSQFNQKLSEFFPSSSENHALVISTTSHALLQPIPEPEPKPELVPPEPEPQPVPEPEPQPELVPPEPEPEKTKMEVEVPVHLIYKQEKFSQPIEVVQVKVTIPFSSEQVIKQLPIAHGYFGPKQLHVVQGTDFSNPKEKGLFHNTQDLFAFLAYQYEGVKMHDTNPVTIIYKDQSFSVDLPVRFTFGHALHPIRQKWPQVTEFPGFRLDLIDYDNTSFTKKDFGLHGSNDNFYYQQIKMIVVRHYSVEQECSIRATLFNVESVDQVRTTTLQLPLPFTSEQVKEKLTVDHCVNVIQGDSFRRGDRFVTTFYKQKPIKVFRSERPKLSKCQCIDVMYRGEKLCVMMPFPFSLGHLIDFLPNYRSSFSMDLNPRFEIEDDNKKIFYADRSTPLTTLYDDIRQVRVIEPTSVQPSTKKRSSPSRDSNSDSQSRKRPYTTTGTVDYYEHINQIYSRLSASERK